MKILKSNRPIDEATARALAAMEVSATVDLLMANETTIGAIRTSVDAMPDGIRQYFEMLYFQEIGKRYQAGKAPWSTVLIFAPDGMAQGLH